MMLVFFTTLHAESLSLALLDGLNQLSLEEAIAFGVRNNRNIKTAYLQRVSQKFDLYVSEGKFLPRMVLSSAYISQKTDSVRTHLGTLTSTATMSLPTGAALSATSTRDNDASTTSFTVVQPLLRDGGIQVNTASVRAARIDDQVNQIRLKDTLAQTVVQIIYAYRELLRAQEQKKIAEAALARSRDLYEVNQALIAAGRMAQVEIIQTEANVANQEVALEEANNQIDSSRLALLNLLAIAPSTALLAKPLNAETLVKEQHFAEAFEIALKNQPDYLVSILGVERTNINLELAKNQQLWDVSLVAGQSQTHNSAGANAGQTSSYTGVQVNIPIGDRTIKQALVNATVDADSQALFVQEIKQVLEQRVRDAVRNVQTRWRQFELSKKARGLTLQKLDAENEKLKVGRSSNFQILQFENDLRNAENAQLNAQIAYLNALTDLDNQTGSTLDVWQIPVLETPVYAY